MAVLLQYQKVSSPSCWYYLRNNEIQCCSKPNDNDQLVSIILTYIFELDCGIHTGSVTLVFRRKKFILLQTKEWNSVLKDRKKQWTTTHYSNQNLVGHIC
jgi:hypothetical protein